ncbi:MAG: hypothetical protein RIC35_07270, partial [Marinoscillum sp.]
LSATYFTRSPEVFQHLMQHIDCKDPEIEHPSIFQKPKQVRHDRKMRNDFRILHQTPIRDVIPNLVRDLRDVYPKPFQNSCLSYCDKSYDDSLRATVQSETDLWLSWWLSRQSFDIKPSSQYHYLLVANQ